MAKTNRTIRFLIVIGIIIFVDAITHMTSIFDGSVKISILGIFGIKVDNMSMYTSIYASVAVLLSSNLTIIKKLGYSIGLFIVYVGIFTFVIGYGVKYPNYSLYPTLVVFITMTFPMLLWIMTDDMCDVESKKVTGDTKKHGKRR